MSNPHQGGNLSDMAVNGTTMPNDAGKYDVLPSVPRPDQVSENSTAFTKGDLGAENLAGAADNSTDIPQQPKDIGITGEVLTGTGDQLPAQTESKRLHLGANNPLDKGHDRRDKHTVQKESDFERYQS